MTIAEFASIATGLEASARMPALFVGHGSPMNAIESNAYVAGWKKLGEVLPHPTAILSISAHWLTLGTHIHAGVRPKTIHDFGGFPKELYDITYGCPGAPDVALATKTLLLPNPATLDTEWGIDHGTWVVLRHMFKNADIPVFQMSIDVQRSGEQHYELGRLLQKLREKGVLIMGSGNMVHNLGKISWKTDALPFAWATSFDEQAKKLLVEGNHQALIHYEKLGVEAELAIPTPDHYWPLLYTLGVQNKNEQLSFPIEGITHGSISMRTIQIG